MQAAGSALPHPKDRQVSRAVKVMPQSLTGAVLLGQGRQHDNDDGGHDTMVDEQKGLRRMEDRQPHLCLVTRSCGTQGAAGTGDQGRASHWGCNLKRGFYFSFPCNAPTGKAG